MVDSTLQEDLDPQETREWQDALRAVIAEEGEERAHFILETLIDQARRSGTYIPYRSTTAYLNTIPVAHEQRSPGDASLEWKIRSFVRWNALAMVMRANHAPASRCLSDQMPTPQTDTIIARLRET